MFKLRWVFLKPLYSNSGCVGCCIVLLTLPKSVRKHNDMNGCRWSARMNTYLSPVRVISRPIWRSHITPTAQAPHHYWVSTSLNRPLLTCRVHGFMRSPYLYTSIHSKQLETRLVRPGNMFPVINHQMLVLTSLGEDKALYRAVSKGTWAGLWPRKPISMMFHWIFLMLTLVDDPASKSAAICRRVALLSC